MFYYFVLFFIYSSQLILYALTECYQNIWPLFYTQINPLSRAIFDNFIHFCHAFLSMLTYCILKNPNYFRDTRYFAKENCLRLIHSYPIICGIFASIIDVDHFLSARSFSLKAATSLFHRPAFHCTTAALILPIAIFIINYFQGSEFVDNIGYCWLIAIITHHLRDGLRRGLWIYPFKSTRPIPHWIYVFCLTLFPHICFLLSCLKNGHKSEGRTVTDDVV